MSIIPFLSLLVHKNSINNRDDCVYVLLEMNPWPQLTTPLVYQVDLDSAFITR